MRNKTMIAVAGLMLLCAFQAFGDNKKPKDGAYSLTGNERGNTKEPAQKTCAFGGQSEIVYDPADFDGINNLKDGEARIQATDQKRIGKQGLLIKGAGNDASFALTSPFTEITPNRNYTLQVFLFIENPADGFKVWPMVKEYTDPRTKPLLPYTQTAARDRGINAQQTNAWIIRSLDFTPRESASYVNFTILAQGKADRVILGGVRLLDSEKSRSAGWNGFQDTLRAMQDEARKRKPLVERTLVFSRSQVKYGLGRNYMRHWIDRPLGVDRSLREEPGKVTSRDSFVRDMQTTRIYDIDGFAFFPETGRWAVYDYADSAGLEGFSLLTEILTPNDVMNTPHLNTLESKFRAVELAKQCKCSARVDGKLLFTSYNSGTLAPGKWGELLKILRAKYGDCFVFLPALTAGVRFKDDFQKKTPIFIEDINEDKAYLREYADACDGIYFHYPAALKMKDRTFDGAFYRELFIPLWESVMAEGPYRHKYFGLSAYHSHSNPALSIGLEEDNTKTLRQSFEAAMNAEPDVIVLPEWDEENENTCFRPTVCNSFTTQRILRYYMSQIRKKAPTPVPGDDCSIPNLVISYRKTLVLGEKLKIELLNVPDAPQGEKYSAILTLRDENNAVIETFAPVPFTSSVLADKTFVLPSEKYAQYRAIVPSLKILGYKGKDLAFERGFHHINLRATWTWDYKYVKQPLRDLIQPEQATFTAGGYDPDTGIMTVNGSFDCAEKIALAEVLEDDDVVYAVDPADEFYRGKAGHALMWIEYRSLYYGTEKVKNIEGTIAITGGSGKWFQKTEGYGISPGVSNDVVGATTVKVKSQVSAHVRGLLVAIPEKDAGQASLDFDFNLFKTKIPVRKIMDRDIYSEEFDGVTLTVSRYFKLPDMPFHLDRNSCAFTAQVRPETKASLIHMRVTTKSGKTFRSMPLLVPGTTGGAMETLRVYSDVEGKAGDVKVQKIRVPDLAYGFNEDRGTMFYTGAGRPFWGQLGGFVDTSTGRGGNGASAESLFAHSNAEQYPDKVKNAGPQWVNKDGKLALQFDGYGNFVVLPREALPRHGAFTMSFELMPLSKKNQYLFVCGKNSSLTLYLKEGKLGGYYIAEGHRRYDLDTDLEVSPGKWSKIELVYDFEQMRISVNGEKRVKPCQGPGDNIGSCGFGGYGKTTEDKEYGGNSWWFEGYLSSFRIVHNAPSDKNFWQNFWRILKPR